MFSFPALGEKAGHDSIFCAWFLWRVCQSVNASSLDLNLVLYFCVQSGSGPGLVYGRFRPGDQILFCDLGPFFFQLFLFAKTSVAFWTCGRILHRVVYACKMHRIFVSINENLF